MWRSSGMPFVVQSGNCSAAYLRLAADSCPFSFPAPGLVIVSMEEELARTVGNNWRSNLS